MFSKRLRRCRGHGLPPGGILRHYCLRAPPGGPFLPCRLLQQPSTHNLISAINDGLPGSLKSQVYGRKSHLFVDLLCRVICQMDMMVFANSGLLMVLQPCLARQILRVALNTCLGITSSPPLPISARSSPPLPISTRPVMPTTCRS